MDLKDRLRSTNFKGVCFWDISPILKDPECFKQAIRELAGLFKNKNIDIIGSNEARGFIIGAPLAYELGVGFVPIRKEGKLPFGCINVTYAKEYEADTIQIQEDAIIKGQNVLLIDDLLATGGTINANIELVEKLGGTIAGLGFLIELAYLGGRKTLNDRYDIQSLIKIVAPSI
ncbi:MAG: adenine phosphoribosyltransferase [Nitrososphaerota archaeon]|uniref:adenine phosphoribosyltransferase n=1 Tax=Candidatus Bathycorpusculum sp. TaxID=2994959 RepID=UPI002829A2D0|nr:adenine phosphoribosyltransferase [Candidatus Termiticorpusculum sp.]MCL2257908.1 adenine phosphoribosyltransferase [Candidatus Termiticorpusculum sp.]MCL2291953.1 adenine phosphoribosyltransferase [Candidatus Termiticorpusculum sp.]MDR0460115.1 adenine phosphoribosyltransferase [Nitrososphaerota archaeon]